MKWTQQELDRLFNPKVVAVVGDKKDRDYNWLRCCSSLQGKVYSVQIDEKEIPGIEAMGIPNYKSLVEIPEPVDYVIVTVPRAVAPRVLEDAIRKGVGGVMFFTSGFAETETEEGVRLQNVLKRMAEEANLKIVGPNCMGIFNPKVGLRHSQDQYYGEAGNVGVISQSGNLASQVAALSSVHGIRISKSVSFGNGIVLDAADYLEYLGRDQDTEIIVMYVEGLHDGRRFFNILREVAVRKPVVVWKGGLTPEGSRAAFSHTASLATSPVLWDSLMSQCGATKVDTLDDILDTVTAFLHIKPSTGRRMGLVATTGGRSVSMADAFAKEGFGIPALAESSYQEYSSSFSSIGASFRNPLDITPYLRDQEMVRRILEILGADKNVDAVAYELNLGFLGRRQESFLDNLVKSLSDYRETLPKPFFAILTAGVREKEAVDVRQLLFKNGIAVYSNFQRASAAFRRIVEYYANLAEMDSA
ncbi:MAG: CoA-binding protein [Chloroflexi bacterium]|nr:CoA-binding protein [Chloroflexota bacterium]